MKRIFSLSLICYFCSLSLVAENVLIVLFKYLLFS